MKKTLIIRLTSLILLLCILSSIFVSCNIGNSNAGGLKEPTTQAKSYYEFFDTVSIIYSYKGDSEQEFEQNHKIVAEVLGKYHKLFDIYYEYSGINNIRTINKNAGKSAVKVDRELIDFLLYCKELYTFTNEKTNIMLGSVLKLWHDCREKSKKSEGILNPEFLPTVQSLTSANEHTSIDLLVINEEELTVYITDPNAAIDVGAIGKGYATEKAAQVLIDNNVTSYVLNIGGNLRAIGNKVDGTEWITGITNPDKSSDENIACRVKMGDTSLVTSGDYERFFYAGDVKYHHIIDPSTLYPAAYFPSVSIFAKDSGLADALSTALFCMSYEEGKALADSIDGVEVVWITFDGTILHTDGVEFVSK